MAVVASVDALPITAPGEAPPVFLSYSHEDKDQVFELRQRLERAGIPCWIDQSKIVAGEDWSERAARAIKTCDVLIVCVSGRSMRSSYVKLEAQMAVRHGKRLLPVHLDDSELPDALELLLGNVVRTPYFDRSDREFDKILQSLHMLLNAASPRAETTAAPAPVSLPVAAPGAAPAARGTAAERQGPAVSASSRAPAARPPGEPARPAAAAAAVAQTPAPSAGTPPAQPPGSPVATSPTAEPAWAPLRMAPTGASGRPAVLDLVQQGSAGSAAAFATRIDNRLSCVVLSISLVPSTPDRLELMATIQFRQFRKQIGAFDLDIGLSGGTLRVSLGVKAGERDKETKGAPSFQPILAADAPWRFAGSREAVHLWRLDSEDRRFPASGLSTLRLGSVVGRAERISVTVDFSPRAGDLWCGRHDVSVMPAQERKLAQLVLADIFRRHYAEYLSRAEVVVRHG